ncbi:hypothetical protein GK047_23720 [Paenibacillus sp. SYP-B3998]|uniref:Beta-lactamase family protein n=1 Tax=Paenibacillus sp. SYP-B3998 TaxID=2678564 RepID=A0A6G4A3N6_9BACL|nr:hypothetical protein [Paenibacillus sp. SYP-B3998]NEW09005.1 hypothetical protein [Paenibacillus sp. SYP-B3998]
MSKYDLNKVGTEDFQARIDEVIDYTIDEKRLVGAVVRVALNGTQCYSRAAGYANREQSRFMQDIEGTSGFRLAPGRALDDTAYQSGGAGKVGSASSASNMRRWRNGTARWPLWRGPITKSKSGGNSQ